VKLAILADIHGNWPALQAVADDIDRWEPDVVVVNGDIVNGGPSNDACLRTVQERQTADGWHVLRGNHEAYVAAWARLGEPLDGPLYELSRLSHWTYGQLQGDVAGLAALPDHWTATAPDGTRLVVRHATLLGDRAGLYPHTSDADARRMVDATADVFVTSHTHIPHQRRLGATRILNTGAVGLTGDGDQRAAYARLTWDAGVGWTLGIRRVAYDVAAAEAAFVTSGFLDQAGPLALMTLVELRTARDAKTRWTALYRQAILQGAITTEAAVTEFLGSPEFRPYLSDAHAAPRHF
jgi:predicted phosphodiesterase